MLASRQLSVLVSSTAGAGHVGTLLPVATALRAAGHDVSWAVAAEAGPAIAARGFGWEPAGISVAARTEAALDRLPAVMALPPTQRRGALFAVGFASICGPAMYDDLDALVERLRPDVVVHEMAELAAVAVTRARGIPLVTVAFSGVLPAWARVESVEAWAPMWDAAGLGAPEWSQLYGDLYVHPFPPSFGQRPEEGNVRSLRPLAAVPDGHPPAWLDGVVATGHAVYATAGTEPPSVMFPWVEVLAAIGQLGIASVATTGPHVDPATLDAPPRGHVERFVLQAWVLPRMSAVISHGGAGTVLGAAGHGLPQVVVPLFADQWENAGAVTDAGCGIVLGPDRRSRHDVADALREVLDSPELRRAATAVAGEIAVMPTATDLVADVEALAG